MVLNRFGQCRHLRRIKLVYDRWVLRSFQHAPNPGQLVIIGVARDVGERFHIAVVTLKGLNQSEKD